DAFSTGRAGRASSRKPTSLIASGKCRRRWSDADCLRRKRKRFNLITLIQLHQPVSRSDLAEERCAQLLRALLGGIGDIEEPETGAETVGPLEIVHCGLNKRSHAVSMPSRNHAASASA